MFTASLAIFVIFLGLAAAQDCAWNSDVDFPTSYPPLLVDVASWQILRPVYEGSDRIVKAANGAAIVVACPERTISALGSESIEGICVGGTDLEFNGTIYNINDLACSSRVGDDTLPLSTTCGDREMGKEASIGFTIVGYPFVEIIRVCFEPTREITLYTYHLIHGANIPAGDGNPDRPSFKGDYDFYTLDPNDCYLTAGQDVFFEELTGDPDYIDTSHSVYFSRGHLAPNADFVTEMEADGTFYYLNAIPQWQPYNGGNWMYLESDARDIASAYGYDFEVWTGPWTQLEVPDDVGAPTQVYICDTQQTSLIPIPAQIWKVVYDPVRDLGVAVMTSNEPHEDPIERFCTEIDCSTITWLTFDSSEFVKGETYCCTVQDLRAADPNAPDLPTAGILTD